MPHISIIIPTYNGERFIAKALESVLNQTYQDYEIIVIDDGSEDHTRQVLQSYLPQIRYFEQENQGVAAARNRGLELAQGELIAFLDQDDVLLPDKLALQVACFEHQPEVGIVHSGWRLVNVDGQALADVQPWLDVAELDGASWIKRMPVLFSAMLFRRDWLERVNGLSSQFKQACDVDLVQRLVLAGCSSVWLKQVTVLYRQHDQNDSLNTLVQAEECWAVLEQFFARPDLPPSIRQVERDSRYYTLVWIAWRLYYTGRLDAMAQHLKRSLAYTPFRKTETVLHWTQSFTSYSADHGQKLDVQTLSGSAVWQELMRFVLQSGQGGL